MAPKKKATKPNPTRRSRSWQGKELDDIRRYYKPPWFSKEGKRQTDRRKT